MIGKGLNLFSGNRLENLAAALSKVLELPLTDVFKQETIIVQSQGMSRWISLSLAASHGIAANISYRFPNAFLYDVLSGLAPRKNELSTFEPSIMTWRIMDLLTGLVDGETFVTLKNYLGGSSSGLKKYQLAALIADTFDQYLLFRPRMIQDWERGKESHWQAELWRKLVSDSDDIHRVELLSRFKEAIEQNRLNTDVFPERISVFGISSLPAFHMEIFDLLSRYMQVNLFLLNPCEHYWGDIVSDAEAKRIKSKASAELYENSYLERGNSLLSSMGGLGRDFFDLINDFNHESITLFTPPGRETLLSAVQSDIFMLKDRGSPEDEDAMIDINDPSVEIHSCHSPMREVEVLKDSILSMLEKDADLSPRDILVMTPDIELFSPLIKSVFDKSADNGKRLPYSIADRSLRNESRIVETFLALLDFAGGRFTVSDVMNILETKAVRDCFDIAEKDLDSISLWIHETHIRWGIDKEHRHSIGLPGFAENSWTDGLKQMLLGYAMPGDGETLYDGTLPYNPIEGDTAELLGNVCEFIDRLVTLSSRLDQKQTAVQWQRLLNGILEDFFFKSDDTQKELQTIRDGVNTLVEAVELAGYQDTIEPAVIRSYLVKKLGGSDTGYGFIAGGITFCAMLPMRSIPFKVICAIGMNSDIYPRQTRAAGFDLIAQYPMRGDRSCRKDDRYLFLEVLISAREKLYLSYTGQSIKDNSAIQPSVLVSELVDYINDVYTDTESEAKEFNSVKHPLQAFNYRYFNGSDKHLFSYSDENYRAAVAHFSENKLNENFITKPLPDPHEPVSEIDVNDLCLFFKNPSKYLLQKRLGIFLNSGFLIPEEDEPFEIDWLDKYRLTNTIAEKRITGEVKEHYFDVVKASGILPYGQTGKNEFQVLEKEVSDFAAETKRLIAGRVKTSVEIDMEVAGVRITGTLDGVYDTRLIHYRYAKIKGKDILDFWIKWLILSASGETKGEDSGGLLAGVEKTKAGSKWTGYITHPVDSPRHWLEKIIELYLDGMKKPLPFFPESSMKCVEMITKKNMSTEEAVLKASTVWAGGQYIGRGESSDPYFDLCFRENNPLTEAFVENSLAVFEPVFANLEKIDPGAVL